MYNVSHKQLMTTTAESLLVRSNEEITNLQISFFSAKSDYGIISIVNDEGTMHYSPYCGDVINGKNWRTFDISFLDNGCYLCRLELSRELIEFKFVVFRDDLGE